MRVRSLIFTDSTNCCAATSGWYSALACTLKYAGAIGLYCTVVEERCGMLMRDVTISETRHKGRERPLSCAVSSIGIFLFPK